jgi:hypothetical protein
MATVNLYFKLVTLVRCIIYDSKRYTSNWIITTKGLGHAATGVVYTRNTFIAKITALKSFIVLATVCLYSKPLTFIRRTLEVY